MLQVAIHDNYRIALSIINSGKHCILFSEIARKVNDGDSFILFAQSFQYVLRMVFTPVVDKDEAPIVPAYLLGGMGQCLI